MRFAKSAEEVCARVSEEAGLENMDKWLPECVKAVLKSAAAEVPATEGVLFEKTAQLTEAYEEFAQRKLAGEDVDPDEFCGRHVGLHSSLEGMLRCDSFLSKEDRLRLAQERKDFPKPGENFLHFELTHVLGIGGFAVVYLAKEQSLGNRLVVVKISKSGAGEASTLGPLNHPNIMPVHSVHVDPETGLSAVCMPFYGSITLCDILDDFALAAVKSSAGLVAPPTAEPKLQQRRQQGPVRAQDYVDYIRRIGVQMGSALHFIHERGIFHRDLKPPNVLITPDGRPMLLDFNVSNEALADPSRVGGTIPYMSPEQLLATDGGPLCDSSMLDARSDLYSLGCMLYELLAGKHPFDPLSLKLTPLELRQEVLGKQQRGIVPIRKLNPTVGIKLARVVESCLAYNPADRPRSAAELTVALQNAQPTWRKARGWIGTHRWLTAAAAVLLVVFAGTAAGLSSMREPYQARHERLAAEALQGQNYLGAVKHYSAMLDDDPNQAEVLLARLRAYMQMGESDKYYFNAAMVDIRLISRLQPLSGELWAANGWCSLRLGNPPSASIFSFEQAIQGGYMAPEVYADLGYCLMEKHYAEAETHLNTALSRPNPLPSALHNRAMVRYHRLMKENGPVPPLQKNPNKQGAGEAQGKNLIRLQASKEDMLLAHRLGDKTLEWYRDAARLWAMSSAYVPEDIDKAFEWMTSATDLGHDPNNYVEDRVFEHLKVFPRYEEIQKRKAGIKPPDALRYVNPLPHWRLD